MIALQGNSLDLCQIETGFGSKLHGISVSSPDTTTGYESGFFRSSVASVYDNEFIVGIRALLWFVVSGNSAND